MSADMMQREGVGHSRQWAQVGAGGGWTRVPYCRVPSVARLPSGACQEELAPIAGDGRHSEVAVLDGGVLAQRDQLTEHVRLITEYSQIWKSAITIRWIKLSRHQNSKIQISDTGKILDVDIR